MHRKEVERRMLLTCLSGSNIYGTNVEGSDKDYKGIFIGPTKEYIVGDLGDHVEQKLNGFDTEEGTGKFSFLDGVKDVAIYELRKYLKLLTKGNPNIIEMMFLKEEHYLYKHFSIDILLSKKEEFLTRQIKSSFAGYANGQIHRMEQHRSWILNPPKKRPELLEFGFTNLYQPLTLNQITEFLEFLWFVTRNSIEFLQPSEELRNLLLEQIDFKHLLKVNVLEEESFEQITKMTGTDTNYLMHIRQSQLYYKEVHKWDCYQHWLRTRNVERAAIEAKIGYDGKHASHAIRLLRMAIEILTNFEVIVDRRDAGDADYLRSIRLGEVQYDEIKTECDSLFAALKNATYHSSIRENIDRDLLKEICRNVIHYSDIYD